MIVSVTTLVILAGGAVLGAVLVVAGNAIRDRAQPAMASQVLLPGRSRRDAARHAGYDAMAH
jgi:uncharacterized membrane protein